MAVFPREDRNPFFDAPYGSGIHRAHMEAVQRENERKARELREREERMWGGSTIDLVCIDGVWQEPPKQS